jgi:hypothetical protein
MGGLCAGLPNFVGLQAGYQGLGHSSVVLLMEAQAQMIAKLANNVRHPPQMDSSGALRVLFMFSGVVQGLTFVCIVWYGVGVAAVGGCGKLRGDAGGGTGLSGRDAAAAQPVRVDHR